MKHFCLSLFLSLAIIPLWSQNAVPTSEQAFNQFSAISDSMSASFSEDDIKTYRRNSFSEPQLQTYLSLHFQRLDLLRYIKNKHSFVLDSYLHSGNWFMQVGFLKESIKSYLDFFDYYEANEKSLSPKEIQKYIEMQSFARSMLAQSYATLGDFDNADLQHKKNMDFTKDLDYIYYPSAINNYSLFLYWHKKELDSAQYFFKQAFTLTQTKVPNHTLIGSIRDNIADIYIDQNKLQLAQPLYEDNFLFFKDAINERSLIKDIPRLISAGAQLVSTNVNLNRLEEAQQVFNELEGIVIHQAIINDLAPSSKLEFLRAKELLYEKQNKTTLAYSTSKEIKRFGDSLQNIANNIDKKWQEELNDITIDRIALNFKIDRIKKETKIKSQRAKLWFIGLLSSIFIILLTALIINRRQHFINAKNKQLLLSLIHI